MAHDVIPRAYPNMPELTLEEEIELDKMFPGRNVVLVSEEPTCLPMSEGHIQYDEAQWAEIQRQAWEDGKCERMVRNGMWFEGVEDYTSRPVRRPRMFGVPGGSGKRR